MTYVKRHLIWPISGLALFAFFAVAEAFEKTSYQGSNKQVQILCYDKAYVDNDFIDPGFQFRITPYTVEMFESALDTKGVSFSYTIVDFCLSGREVPEVGDYYYDTRVIFTADTVPSDTVYIDRFGVLQFDSKYFQLDYNQHNALRSGLIFFQNR